MNTFEIMTQPGCQPCLFTEKKFSKHEIPFEARDIRQDADAFALCRELGYSGTPVVVVRNGDGEITDHWNEYRPDRIQGYATV